jgi:hypothetical protein
VDGVDQLDLLSGRCWGALGADVRRVDDDAQLQVGLHRAHGLHRQPVREQLVVRHRDRGGRVGEARCMHARSVAEVGVAPRLVERRPHGHAVAVLARHQRGVVAEPADRVAVTEAADVLQILGKIPVEQRGARHDVVLQQPVDEARVERDALGVHGAATVRHHPRPRDAEAVGLQTERRHHRHVVVETVVVVAGQVAGVAVGHLALGVRERVPHALAATALLGGTLDLVAGGGCTPQEAVGELESWSCGHRVKSVPDDITLR